MRALQLLQRVYTAILKLKINPFFHQLQPPNRFVSNNAPNGVGSHPTWEIALEFLS